ncbi:TPA: hypothetical protein ACU9OW_000013 [Legionella pneumophila]
MNDFTKEELILLGGCAFSQYVSSLRDPTINHLQDDLKKLRGKIQSMIDNYCEHDNVKSLSDADYVYRCSDCDKIVGYK